MNDAIESKPTIKPLRQPTKKQNAFIKEVIDNPKQSLTESAAKTYNVTTRRAAEQIAYENMRKPVIVSRLNEYTTDVEATLYGTVKDWGNNDQPRKREIAQQAAMYIHDKVHGKATQRIETKSEAIVINIDMSKQVNTQQD